MLRISRWRVDGMRVGAVVAALIGCVVAARVVYRGDPVASDEPKPADMAAADEGYEDPEAMAERFSSELGRIADQREVTSSETLAEQAAEEKTCNVETTADAGRKLTPQEIYARARQGVVVVGGIAWCKRHHAWHASCATGFVINRAGVIVTNCHVVTSFQAMRAVGVMTHDGRVLPIKEVLAADAVNDVAVLKVEADDLSPLPLAKSVPMGGSVYCLSHPALNCAATENAFFTFTQGTVCGKFRLRTSGDQLVNVLAITADYATGSSGGPILNEHGAVVGIVCQNLPLCSDEAGADVQMTWKFCRPSRSILALVGGGPAAAKP